MVASGPSLHPQDMALVAQAAAAGKIEAVAVNDVWTLLPAAAVLYAADHEWWDAHKGAAGFAGERWTQDKPKGQGAACAARWGLACIRSEDRAGMSFDPAIVHQGYNSGYQAVNLAVLFGATRVLLLGFDCQPTGGRRHWFGDHPGKLNRASPYPEWVRAFTGAAPQLAAAGVEVVNCSRATALECFPRMPIGDALARLP